MWCLLSVRKEWRQGLTAILTPVLPRPYQYFFRILAWVAETGATKGPKTSVCSWFSLRHPVSNWLEPPRHLVILFSHFHLLLLFFCLFTQVHLLIDGSVEGPYITIIPFLFFRIHWHFLHVSLHPPHTHILQIMVKDSNSKNAKTNYLNNSKIQKS